MHILVEGFSVFGVQVQYWMPLAVLIVAVGIAIGVRKPEQGGNRWREPGPLTFTGTAPPSPRTSSADLRADDRPP
jgi:hypothetical protein